MINIFNPLPGSNDFRVLSEEKESKNSDLPDTHSPEKKVLQIAFPGAFEQQKVNDPSKAYSAWPLPGAVAKRLGTKPATVKKAKSQTSRQTERNISRLRLFQRHRKKSTVVAIKNDNVAGSPGKNKANKESMMSGRSFNRETGNSKRFLLDGRKITTHPPRTGKEYPLEKQTGSTNITLPKIANTTGSVVPEENIYSTLNIKPMPAVVHYPRCLKFYNADVLQLQIEKARFQPYDMRICVPVNTVPLFEFLFTRPLDNWGGNKPRLITTLAINEVNPQEVKKMKFNKFRGLGEMIRNTNKSVEKLGSDRIYSVVTLSIIPNHQLIKEKISGSQILPQNSFKIIQHVDQDGTSRLFMAFFCHQLDKGSRVNAGFLEIKSQWGQFKLTDQDTGFEFSSADMDDFIAGLKKLTGLNFRPDSGQVPVRRGDEQPSFDPLFSREKNLFIRTEAAMRTIPPYGEINIDNSLRFFSQFSFEEGPCDSAPTLYRNCFLQDGDCLRYVDDMGKAGRLEFTTSDTPEQQQLKSPPYAEHAFLLGLGAVSGKNYTLPQIVSLLESQHLIALEPAKNMTRRLYAPGFYIQGTKPEITRHDREEISITGEEHISNWCGSCFSFNENRLQFSDHLGNQGTLNFIDKAGGLQIASENSPEALLFIQEYGLKSNETYTLKQVQDRLYAQGLVQIPHRLV